MKNSNSSLKDAPSSIHMMKKAIFLTTHTHFTAFVNNCLFLLKCCVNSFKIIRWEKSSQQKHKYWVKPRDIYFSCEWIYFWFKLSLIPRVKAEITPAAHFEQCPLEGTLASRRDQLANCCFNSEPEVIQSMIEQLSWPLPHRRLVRAHYCTRKGQSIKW